MISVDTNILVRIFVDDESDRSQIDKARQSVRNHDRVYVSQVVLVETIWVLKSLYDFPKEQIIEVLEHLLNNQALVLENQVIFKDALTLYRETNVDFSDTMILANSRRKGYPLLTFDKKLLKLDAGRCVKCRLSLGINRYLNWSGPIRTGTYMLGANRIVRFL